MKLLILLGIIVLTLQNGANCQGSSSGNGLLSLEEVDGAIVESAKTEFFGFNSAILNALSFAKLYTPGLTKTLFGKKIEAPHCQDRLVCQVDCSQFFPKCKNPIQYMETKPTDDAEDQSVYSKVCVQRWYEDPNQSYFFTNVVIPTLKQWNKDFGVSGSFTTFQQFEDEVNKSFRDKPGYNALMTFINYSKLYRSFQKLCQMNANWASQIDSKITEFENAPIPNEPSGINEIRLAAKDFEAKFNAEVAPVASQRRSVFGFQFDLSAIINAIKSASKNKFGEVRNAMKKAYKDAIMEGNAPICKCDGFKKHYDYSIWWNTNLGGKKIWLFTFPFVSTPNYLNNIYPPREKATRNFCQSKC